MKRRESIAWCLLVVVVLLGSAVGVYLKKEVDRLEIDKEYLELFTTDQLTCRIGDKKVGRLNFWVGSYGGGYFPWKKLPYFPINMTVYIKEEGEEKLRFVGQLGCREEQPGKVLWFSKNVVAK